MTLDRRDEAATVYLDLINRNPENWNYYKGLEDAIRPGRICVKVHLSLVVRKPVFGVSNQVQHKPGCTATEDGQRLEIL